jgi:hypothetical protein
MPEEEAVHFPGDMILWLMFLGGIIFLLILISPHYNPLAYFFEKILPWLKVLS